MFCKECGCNLRSDALFCPQCGTKVDFIVHKPSDIPVESSVSDTAPSIDSGKSISPSLKPRQSENPLQAKVPAAQKTAKSGKKALWITVGCVSALLLVVLLYFLTSHLSKAKINSDLKEYFSEQYGATFEWDGITIDKRQTDRRNKIDLIYVTWEAHNDICAIKNEAALTYWMYNDGWHLETVESHRVETTILGSDISSEDVMLKLEDDRLVQRIDGGELEEIDHSLDLDSGREVFVYAYTIEYYYCTVQYTAHVNYSFENTSWHYDGIDWDDGETQWDITGEWICSTNNAQIWLNFLSFSEEDGGEVEYSVKYNYTGWYSSGVQTVSSSQPVKVLGRAYDTSDGIHYLEIDLEGIESSDGDDPGYLTLYPSLMEWNAISADGGSDDFELLPKDSSPSNVAISNLLLKEENNYNLWTLDKTAPDGKTYNPFCEFSSISSWWGIGETDPYALFELNGNYSKISGTYFCDENMSGNMTASLYIYADGKCVFSKENCTVGDGVMKFEATISGAQELKISVIGNNPDNSDHYPKIVIVDTHLS